MLMAKEHVIKENQLVNSRHIIVGRGTTQFIFMALVLVKARDTRVN